MPPKVIVAGAGVGGLSAAALLVKAGYDVTVLEAHVYAGGCAGTFYHQGYRFDAGATLAGGFAPGGPHARLAEMLDLHWPVTPVDPAWAVHLPEQTITQWSGADEWRAERRRAFPRAEAFWRRQEALADAAWDVAARPFPWPPASPRDLVTLAAGLRARTLLAAPYAFRTVASLLPNDDPALRLFVDSQLLISAQALAGEVNALYGSAALDLPRRGVNHVRGGIGALANTLVDWIRQHGGQVLFRQKVVKIRTAENRAVAVETDKGLNAACDYVVANLTPWALAQVLGDQAPAGLTAEVRARAATWGAFTLYLGLEAAALPRGGPDHHQVVLDPSRPLGEGNSVFISLSDPADAARAPRGMRAATLSTHTAIAPWRAALAEGGETYEARKADYADRLLRAAERAVPGLRRAVRLSLPGTPAAFEYFTRRPLGMVGGFPQTSLLRARGPHTALANAWLVGDSVFPGQSTAGVTVGAMRVAAAVARAGGRAVYPHPRARPAGAA